MLGFGFGVGVTFRVMVRVSVRFRSKLKFVFRFYSHFFLISAGGAWQFSFNVKFYPPDPAQLSEDITRYLKFGYRKDKHLERVVLPLNSSGKSMLTCL